MPWEAVVSGHARGGDERLEYSSAAEKTQGAWEDCGMRGKQETMRAPGGGR